MKKTKEKNEKKTEEKKEVKKEQKSPYPDYTVVSVGHSKCSVKEKIATYSEEVQAYYNVRGNDWWILKKAY